MACGLLSMCAAPAGRRRTRESQVDAQPLSSAADPDREEAFAKRSRRRVASVPRPGSYRGTAYSYIVLVVKTIDMASSQLVNTLTLVDPCQFYQTHGRQTPSARNPSGTLPLPNARPPLLSTTWLRCAAEGPEVLAAAPRSRPVGLNRILGRTASWTVALCASAWRSPCASPARASDTEPISPHWARSSRAWRK